MTGSEKLKVFHRSRRMFCIYQDKLYIAKPNLSYSHDVWLEKEGLISKEKNELIDEIVRGFVNPNEDVYFYSGHDFKINSKIEHIFFSHLEELVGRLKLNSTANIFGGLIVGKAGEAWIPKRKYGRIENNL